MIHLHQVIVGIAARDTDDTSGSLFSYVDLEERIPVQPRQVVNGALASSMRISAPNSAAPLSRRSG